MAMRKLELTIANTSQSSILITSVGIDISKGKNTVTIHSPSDEIVLPPVIPVPHKISKIQRT